jgi:hypothetical protein
VRTSAPAIPEQGENAGPGHHQGGRFRDIATTEDEDRVVLQIELKTRNGSLIDVLEAGPVQVGFSDSLINEVVS